MLKLDFTWLHTPRQAFLGILLLSLLAGASVVHAQDRPEARTITFDEAVNIALQQNTKLLRTENTLEQRKIEVASNWADFLPELTINSGGRYKYGRQFSNIAGQIITEKTNLFSVGAGTSINLFNGFRKFASLDRAQFRAAAGTQRLERSRADVVFEVMQRYINLIESRAQIRVREEELAYQREQLEQIEALVDVGTQPASDLYQQQARVAEAELALLNAEQAAEVARTQLIGILNVDPLGQYHFTAPSLENVEPTRISYELEQLIERAYDQRNDLDAQQLAVRAAEEGVDVAQSGYYPTLNFSAAYGSSWSDAVLRPAPNQPDGAYQPSFFEQLNNRRGGSFTLRLGFSLFDRMQTRHAVEAAQVELQTTRYELKDLRQQIALQVRQAYLDYQKAKKSLTVSKQRLEAASRAREAAQARYQLGAATYVEFAQANAAYVSAASQRVRNRYTLLFRKKLLTYYVGTLDPTEPLLQ